MTGVQPSFLKTPSSSSEIIGITVPTAAIGATFRRRTFAPRSSPGTAARGAGRGLSRAAAKTGDRGPIRRGITAETDRKGKSAEAVGHKNPRHYLRCSDKARVEGIAAYEHGLLERLSFAPEPGTVDATFGCALVCPKSPRSTHLRKGRGRDTAE